MPASRLDESQIPAWFNNALSTPFSDHQVRSGGTMIHYQLWNPSPNAKPGLILIHGHGAHAHWWDFIAPMLLDEFKVLAMDVSGAGDSAHRESYSNQQFIQEVLDVKADAGFGQDTILVGHSFGGRIARHTAHQQGSDFQGLVLVDSAMGFSKRSGAVIISESNRPTRFYPSREEAARRFRLRPPQTCHNRYILNYIAMHSVRKTHNGWAWKLDQNVFARMPDLRETQDPVQMVRELACRVGFIYGEQSRFFNDETIADLRGLIPADALIGIADARHHLILDQPLVFVSALKNILLNWK